MRNNLRSLLHKKVTKILPTDNTNSNKISEKLTLKFDKASGKYFFELPLLSKSHDIREKASKLLSDESEQYLEHTEINSSNPNQIKFYPRKDEYVRGLLNSFVHNVVPLDFMCNKSDHVVIEFSSPNIAKPFHVGHLRSTIIGNFVANINEFYKNNVRRINYLGDWGTQFGFVQLGLSLANIPDEVIKKDPINSLYNAYVYANKLAENDPTIAIKARELFSKLENGDSASLSEWQTFRNYTLKELERTYQRIGVKFDDYYWESMYSIKKMKNVLSEIERLNLLVEDEQNRKVIQLEEEKSVPLIKSDGTSLYLTRDIAAAIDRFEKYNFDAMYYVVDNAQRNHFKNLIGVLNSMQLPWAHKIKHINFGKIKGMSTRKGTVVFLQDILDETKTRMREQQLQSANTKVNLESDHESTEILGISAVLINDLKHKRNQDYDFNWKAALDTKGDSGIMLQYAHCRLVSLEENSGATIASECDPSFLSEPSAEELVFIIGKFDEVVARSYIELESCLLVHYLFRLSHAINKAFRELRIKDQPADLANQRLLLMHAARKVLSKGMSLLGLTPLNKM